MTGRKHSPETIEKMRQKALGRGHTQETKEVLRQYGLKQFEDPKVREEHGQKMRGRVATEETRQKLSLAHRGRIQTEEQVKRKTELLLKHYDKKGRRDTCRDSSKYQTCKKTVHERDSYTCQHCGKLGLVGKDCHVHHIKDWDNFPELRYEISNGLTLCMSCHMKEERKLGNGYNFQTGKVETATTKRETPEGGAGDTVHPK